jgi:hypothetical protein
VTTKPRIHCPHCDAIFPASKLAATRKYRNKFGIDVFGCPECSRAIKIEPREYLFVSQQIARGETSEDVAIGAASEHDTLPSEQLALNEKKAGCLSVIAVVGLGLGAFLAYLV